MSHVTKTARGSIRISATSWHYRVYRWWQDRQGVGFDWRLITSERREDLCHYRKVLLLYVPLTLVFHCSIYRWIKPWMVLVAGAMVAALGWGLYVDPENILKILLGVLGAFLGIAIFIALMFVWYWLDKNRPGAYERGISTIGLIGAFLRAIKDRFCPYVELPEKE